jgi:hypothetical protein
MGDDGNGKNVYIPGILISKSDGEILKNFYKKNLQTILQKPILLEIDFEMKTNDDVDLDIYFESNDFNILILLKNLKIYLENLKLSIKFMPRFLSFKHPFFNETNNNSNIFNIENCINKGRYCVNPRGLKNKKLFGSDVIRNNLFIKCAFYVDDSSNENIYKQKFFDFIEFFVDDCLDYSYSDSDLNKNKNKKENYFTEKCMNESLIKGGFKLKDIMECIDNSFWPIGIYYYFIFFQIFFYLGLNNINNPNARNNLLDLDNENKINQYLKMIPSILINKRTYYVQNKIKFNKINILFI